MVTNEFEYPGLPNVNIDGQVRADALLVSPVPDPRPVLRIYWASTHEENQTSRPELSEVREKVLVKSAKSLFVCISIESLELTVQV